MKKTNRTSTKLSVLIRQAEGHENNGEPDPDMFLIIPKLQNRTNFLWLNRPVLCHPHAEKQSSVMLYLSNPVKTTRYFA